MQKHAFHSSNKSTCTVTVFTNYSVMFVTFSVPSGFYPYMSIIVHIRMVKHTARRSPIEAMIVKTTPDFISFTSLFKF